MAPGFCVREMSGVWEVNLLCLCCVVVIPHHCPIIVLHFSEWVGKNMGQGILTIVSKSIIHGCHLVWCDVALNHYCCCQRGGLE